jgi:hypothetical protein
MVANPGDSLAKGSITMSESLRRIRNRKVSERRDLFKMVVTICDGPDDGAIPVTEKKNRALLTLSLQTRGKPHSQGGYDKTEDSFLSISYPYRFHPRVGSSTNKTGIPGILSARFKSSMIVSFKSSMIVSSFTCRI